jgi:hypothetical protein
MINMVDKTENLFVEIHCRKIILDVVTYGPLIEGSLLDLELVNELHELGKPPNVITFNSILDV